MSWKLRHAGWNRGMKRVTLPNGKVTYVHPTPPAPSPVSILQGEKRSLSVAYILWALGLPWSVVFHLPPLGGLHRFYCRKPATGVLWLFSGGLCGVGQLVDFFLIPEMVRQANQQHVLEQAFTTVESGDVPPIERQLLQLARRCGPQGFTLNDALLEMQPAAVDSQVVSAEIQRLLLANLLDVGNDERGRVIYREP